MNINIEYDELLKTGNEIIALSNNFDDIVGKMGRIIELMKISWSGKDEFLYNQSLEEYIIKLNTLKKMVEDNGKYLIGISSIYQTFDINSANNARKSDWID